MQDSFLDEGFILDKRIGVGQPKRIEVSGGPLPQPAVLWAVFLAALGGSPLVGVG